LTKRALSPISSLNRKRRRSLKLKPHWKSKKLREKLPRKLLRRQKLRRKLLRRSKKPKRKLPRLKRKLRLLPPKLRKRKLNN